MRGRCLIQTTRRNRTMTKAFADGWKEKIENKRKKNTNMNSPHLRRDKMGISFSYSNKQRCGRNLEIRPAPATHMQLWTHHIQLQPIAFTAHGSLLAHRSVCLSTYCNEDPREEPNYRTAPSLALADTCWGGEDEGQGCHRNRQEQREEKDSLLASSSKRRRKSSMAAARLSSPTHDGVMKSMPRRQHAAATANGTSFIAAKRLDWIDSKGEPPQRNGDLPDSLVCFLPCSSKNTRKPRENMHTKGTTALALEMMRMHWLRAKPTHRNRQASRCGLLVVQWRNGFSGLGNGELLTR
ncbi:hypothetical protein MKZ38_008952 [Zalerion maritima]|uniref:Uncharacterized protein n=1 Tax=Zalerion maritima TaxID=339359 RepID=A0AAD5RVT0_9PEZI|nr:hypothetical protein MKZ38_008952 [Zalerion maritima]